MIATKQSNYSVTAVINQSINNWCNENMSIRPEDIEMQLSYWPLLSRILTLGAHTGFTLCMWCKKTSMQTPSAREHRATFYHRARAQIDGSIFCTAAKVKEKQTDQWTWERLMVPSARVLKPRMVLFLYRFRRCSMISSWLPSSLLMKCGYCKLNTISHASQLRRAPAVRRLMLCWPQMAGRNLPI